MVGSSMPNSELRMEIETALAAKSFRLRFPPVLEVAFQVARSADRNRSIAKYLVVYLAAKMLFLLANLEIGSKVFRVSMTLRLGIVLPLTLIAIFLLLRHMPTWVYGVAAFAPLIAETALVVLLGRLSGSSVSARYVMAAGVGIFAQTLLMRAPFHHCVRGLALALAVFCALSAVSWPGHFGPPVSSDYLIFVIAFSLPALYERHSRERADRRDFLLSEMNRLRMEDIQRMNSHLERLSSMDALTGVFNRRYLDAALARSWDVAVDHRRRIGILMIDIDHFKALNDSFGHQYGDLCLVQVAQMLQKSVRAGVDTVARYGGEEFVAILPDANQRQTVMTGERIRKAIEAAGIPGAQGRVVTISTGAISICGEAASEQSVKDLVATADKALYTAKTAGRNRVEYCEHAQIQVEPHLTLCSGLS